MSPDGVVYENDNKSQYILIMHHKIKSFLENRINENSYSTMKKCINHIISYTPTVLSVDVIIYGLVHLYKLLF